MPRSLRTRRLLIRASVLSVLAIALHVEILTFAKNSAFDSGAYEHNFDKKRNESILGEQGTPLVYVTLFQGVGRVQTFEILDRGKEGRVELGKLCLINEMQFLVENGWVHV